MDRLPEDCVGKVLSLTSPEDTCRLSLVNTTFRGAAESDVVWEKFLPPDYKYYIEQDAATTRRLPSVRGPGDLPPTESKKKLYLWLSDHPLIFDRGNKSFSLEKRSGKRCYMLAARDLTIVWGNTPNCLRWMSCPESRFGEVAELISVGWLEIRGKINVCLLSPNTTYTAFLVFKLTESAFGFEYKPAEVSIRVRGGETKTRMVYLDPDRGQRLQRQIILPFFNRGPRGIDEEEGDGGVELEEGFYPKVREDSWMEIELGDYCNGNGGDREKIGDKKRKLKMSLKEVRGGDWKSGLIVQGIEIRPKVANK